LYAVCDHNVEIASKYSKQYLVKSLTFNEIINDANVEGIVLTVPAKLHAVMAIDAMNKGKHVFVEKPLALNVSDAKIMVETAKKNNVKLMVGHLLQYHPIFKNIKKLVHEGKIGNLEYIYSNRLSFGRVRSEEDVIWSFAAHDVSMILSLAAEKPIVVKADTKFLLQKNLADIANIYLEFSSGLKSCISVSWINPFKKVELIIVGSTAMLVFDDTKLWDEKLAIYSYNVKKIDRVINLEKSYIKYLVVAEEEPLKKECEHFFDVIDKNIEPLTDGYEGLEVIRVLSNASQSAINNKKDL
jgi:predicted dehydrogenase